MRSGLGPVLTAGQPALPASCVGGKPSFDLWNCLLKGSPGHPGILARDLPCDPQWPTRKGPSDAYLNENYLVLRAVVERLGGQDYCTYVKNKVLNHPGEETITCNYNAIPPVLYYGEDMSPGTDFSGDFGPSAGPIGWYASARELARFLNSLRSDSILRRCRSTARDYQSALKCRTLPEPSLPQALRRHAGARRLQRRILRPECVQRFPLAPFGCKTAVDSRASPLPRVGQKGWPPP